MAQDGRGGDGIGSGAPGRRKKRTPQEKKALSYRHDRRNAYGNNDKAARRAIPLSKALSHRRLRHGDKAALRDPEAAVEAAPLRLGKPDWRKGADISLGAHIRRQKWRHAAAAARSRGEMAPEAPDREEPWL